MDFRKYDKVRLVDGREALVVEIFDKNKLSHSCDFSRE